MDIDADAKTTPPTSKSLYFTNGTHKCHSTATATATEPPPPSMVVSYKECLKNHAASIGGHAVDGCGEFMPSSSTNPTDPRSLKCAACGCHRNFHRREPQEPNTTTTTNTANNNSNSPSFLNCIYSPSAPPPPPPPQLPHRGLNQSTSPSLSSSPSPSPSPISSPSPPPISHLPPSYNTSAPHMLLALGSAYSAPSDGNTHNLSFSSVKMESVNLTASAKKRYRTKFSKEQKEKMFSLSEKLGWRMQKGDDGLVQQFCNDIGVSRGVFKVWMHNNKNTFKKRSKLGNNEFSQNDEKMNNNVDNDAGNNAAAGGFNSDTNNPNNSSNNNVHVSLNGLSS